MEWTHNDSELVDRVLRSVLPEMPAGKYKPEVVDLMRLAVIAAIKDGCSVESELKAIALERISTTRLTG
jgi:hypothetical protein